MPGRRHKPFASKAQQGLFFASPRLRRYAKGKAHATGEHSSITKRVGYSPAYRRLPERVGSVPHGRPRRGGANRSSGGRRRA